MVGVVPALLGLLEPGVLIRGVVHHQIQHDLQPQLMGFGQQGVKIRHGAESRLNLTVVGNVIAVVHLRGLVDGDEPQHIHPQIGQVGQLGTDAVQVAQTVAVGVAEALGVDLIDNGLFPPLGVIHPRHPLPKPDR